MRTMLGLEIEDTNSIPDLGLSSHFKDRVWDIAAIFGEEEFYVEVYHHGPTPNGVMVIIVGERFCSRAIGVHPDDPPGLIYALQDDGQEIDLSQPAIAEKAFWLGDLIKDGLTSIKDKLELDRHKNRRVDPYGPPSR